MDATGTESAVIVGFSAGALWGTLLAAEHPERVDGAVFIAPAAPFGMHRARVTDAVRRATGVVRGLGEVQPALLARELPRLPRVLLLADLRRAALDQADRGLRRLGPRDDGRDARADRDLGRKLNDPDEFRRLCERITCPVLVIHGTDDAVRTVVVGRSRWPTVTGGDPRRARGRRPLPARARSGAREPAAARLRSRRRLRRGPGRAAATAASARSTSRRRSASATRGATSRSPASCATSTPTSRSTGSPSTR